MAKQCKITAFFKPPGTPLADTKNTSESNKRVFSDDDFVAQPSKARRGSSGFKKGAYSVTGPVRCPFYKKIPQTTFAVDAFKYGLIDGIKYYFLTHFHADHYMGLRKSFTGTIVCSPITARLVNKQLGVDRKYIQVVDVLKPTAIDDVQVLFLDANHCPGAVIILFTLKNSKRILHTGDFRASPLMQDSLLKYSPIDDLYLDTTYCDPKYAFPPQEEAIDHIVSIAKAALQKEPKTLIVSGTYSVGKEKVFIAIGLALNLNVWISPSKKRLLDCYEDKDLNRLITSNQQHPKIHVLSMREINLTYLRDYIKKHGNLFKTVLAFKPTGWEYKRCPLNEIKPHVKDNVHIYGIPYSEHCSFDELQSFIRTLKPRNVIPTVNIGNPKKREEIQKFINSWLQSEQK